MLQNKVITTTLRVLEQAFEQIAFLVEADDKRDFWHRCAPEGAIVNVG
jgi:hypothetical protein